MSKILVIVTTGKENINAEMVAFNFALNTKKNAGAEVEMLFLGRGIQALNAKQRNSDQFAAQVENVLKAGIKVKGCSVSAEAEGIEKSALFPGVDAVMGGIEVNRKIEEGYVPLTF